MEEFIQFTMKSKAAHRTFSVLESWSKRAVEQLKNTLHTQFRLSIELFWFYVLVWVSVCVCVRTQKVNQPKERNKWMNEQMNEQRHKKQQHQQQT